jgi:Putative beta barrel porin-7 (BBP7)
VQRPVRQFLVATLLWVSTVARAGEQIDPVLNMKQILVKEPPGPLVGSARPVFNFVGTDFWAQGFNFGLDLR